MVCRTHNEAPKVVHIIKESIDLLGKDIEILEVEDPKTIRGISQGDQISRD